MPNLEMVMRRAVSFTNAVTPSPLCSPARACLASGLRYGRCGVPDNQTNFPLDKRTFYAVLRDCGYQVGGVGKFDLQKNRHYWGMGGFTPEHAIYGFTTALDSEGKMDAVKTALRNGRPSGPYMKYLYDKGMGQIHIDDMAGRGLRVEPTPLPDEDYCDNWVARNALYMLDLFRDDAPWFIQVNFPGPHDPFDVTRSMRDRWKDTSFEPPHNWRGDADVNGVRQNYAAMLENIDYNIGLILEKVKKRGELGKTIIAYSSDHGEMLGDEGRFGKLLPTRGSVGIPLVISTPGMAGRYCDGLVELQDLAATFVDYAGGGFPEGEDSVSLRRILDGETNVHREAQVTSLCAKAERINGGYKLIFDGKYKYLEYKNGERHLFDCSQDPWETRCVIDKEPEKAERLSKFYSSLYL
jgi:arylsulfatase A-like enzyme